MNVNRIDISYSAPVAADAPAPAAAASPPHPPEISLAQLMPQQAPEAIAIGRDPLSLVATFLAPSDQLVLRQIDESARLAVDPQIQTLEMTGEAALTLLREPHTISRLQIMQLSDCDEAILIELAELLRRTPNPHLTLQLMMYDNPQISARALEALSTTSLAGLKLTYGLDEACFDALSLFTFPISLELVYDSNVSPDYIHRVSQIQALTELDTDHLHLSEATVNAIRTHTSLKGFSPQAVDADKASGIIGNPHLQSLTIERIIGNATPVFEALADHPALTSVDIHVRHSTDLAMLARNARIETLEVRLSQAACEALPQLARMRSLKGLSLSCFEAELQSAHIQAVCAMPLDSLTFSLADMDKAMRALVTTASARHLALDRCTPLDDDDVDRLNANAKLQSLELFRVFDDTTAQRWIGNLPITLDRANVTFGSANARLDRERISQAWAAAGKMPLHLELNLYDKPLAVFPPH